MCRDHLFPSDYCHRLSPDSELYRRLRFSKGILVNISVFIIGLPFGKRKLRLKKSDQATLKCACCIHGKGLKAVKDNGDSDWSLSKESLVG